jgi:uncharacterized membrane protein
LNKYINISILLILGIFISLRINVACSELEKLSDEEVPEETFSVPVSYSGVLPCASCPGIQYSLVLEDEKFTEASWYIDKDPNPFVKNGTWQQSADTLRLFDDSGELLKSFLLEGREIILLDETEERISGDLADNYRLFEISEFISIQEHLQALKKDGIEFTASGNEPFWSVRISTDRKLNYQTPDTSISIDARKLADSKSEPSAGNTIIYHALSGTSEYILQINPVHCQDDMSGFLFTHSVTFTIDNKLYRGCGTFL